MISQVKAGAIMSYLTLTINIIVGMVYTPWMISSIGSSDYGLYALALSVINIFVFDFGLGTAVQRFVAKYLAEGRIEKANLFIGITVRVYLLIDLLTIIVLITLFFFIPNIYKGLSPSDIEKFKFIYIIVAIYSVISFPLSTVDAIIAANEKFIQLKACDFIHKIFIVFSMSICLLLDYGLYALVFVNALAGFITLLLKIIILKKYTSNRININNWDKNIFHAILGFSAWTLITAFSQRCILGLSPNLLGIFNSANEITIFSLALSIEGYFYLFANAINGLFLPRVSRMIAQGESNGIMDLMIKVGRIQILIIGLVYLGLICFGHHFINVWVGNEFQTVYYCMILMIAPSVISLPQNIAQTTMVANNFVRQLAYPSIMKVVVYILLALPLSKYYGALGMSLSVSISYFISVIVLNYYYKSKLKVDIRYFFISTFGKYLLPLLILALCGFLINFLITSLSWGTLFIKGTLFCLLYIIVFIPFIGRERLIAIIKSINKL